MKKEELIRYRAALAALLVSGSMFLGGCTSSEGFRFARGENNKYVAMNNTLIDNACIDKCYVVEAYNKITEETELFIAKRSFIFLPKKLENGEKGEIPYYYYLDLMNNNNKLFYQDNSLNSAFEFIKETPLYDYMITLDLLQAKYSHEDMQRVLEEIKSVYKFESDKELVK